MRTLNTCMYNNVPTFLKFDEYRVYAQILLLVFDNINNLKLSKRIGGRKLVHIHVTPPLSALATPL
jgi:hypothetical protein